MGNLLKLWLPDQTTKGRSPHGQSNCSHLLYLDDILKGLYHCEDKQRQMSDAEVLTTSIVAGLFFSGNMEKSRIFLQEHGYIPKMLEKSRFNRRQHMSAKLFLMVVDLLGNVWKQLNEESVYVMDSFPVSACDN